MSAISVIRFIYLAGISVWFGMLVFFSFFAAPSIFKILPREAAGEVVGDIFPKYWLAGYICALSSFVSLIVISIMEKAFPAAKIIILAVMTATTFYSGLVVGEKARGLKAEIKTEVDPVKKETLRAEFKRTHFSN